MATATLATSKYNSTSRIFGVVFSNFIYVGYDFYSMSYTHIH